MNESNLPEVVLVAVLILIVSTCSNHYARKADHAVERMVAEAMEVEQ